MIEMSKFPMDSDTQHKLYNLLEWLDKENAEYNKLRVREYSHNYRGVHAKCDIEAGEIILLIPKE